MAPLANTNKYLSDEASFRRMVGENVRASSLFEGASPRALNSVRNQPESRKVMASKKKSASGS